jgi:hypothetical protein
MLEQAANKPKQTEITEGDYVDQANSFHSNPNSWNGLLDLPTVLDVFFPLSFFRFFLALLENSSGSRDSSPSMPRNL